MQPQPTVPVVYASAVSRWVRMPDGNVVLEFVVAEPVERSNDMSTRTILRIVMAPQVVAQTGAFLAAAFPLAAPDEPPASAH